MHLRRASLGNCLFVWLASHLGLLGAEVSKAPVPKSPYLPVVYRYADAMLKSGRDTYGPQTTGLFLSALDRTTLALLTHRPPAPAGVRESDRVGAREQALVGANPQHDENLLRLLYTLSELSGKAIYRAAAAAELKWFLENARSPWGEKFSWDVMKDEAIAANGAQAGTHEFFRPWLLWDRCFELVPEASKRSAFSLWQRQMANPKTDTLDRKASSRERAAQDDVEFPRQAGFDIRTWAAAYAHTKDEQFLRAIEALLERCTAKRQPKTGLLEAHTGSSQASAVSMLSLAIDCDGAAHRVPEPLAGRLRTFAAREDEIFCAQPHDLKATGGFWTGLNKATSESSGARTSPWTARYGDSTTAQVGMMCVSRYDNTGKTGYRELIIAAADAYAKSLPSDDADVWPMTFGHAISLQLAAWRHTARLGYLEGARKLADLALEEFFQNSPLPRASVKSDHYESITGADTLALALVELHLNVLHITAVRCPPNTIDR